MKRTTKGNRNYFPRSYQHPIVDKVGGPQRPFEGATIAQLPSEGVYPSVVYNSPAFDVGGILPDEWRYLFDEIDPIFDIIPWGLI